MLIFAVLFESKKASYISIWEFSLLPHSETAPYIFHKIRPFLFTALASTQKSGLILQVLYRLDKWTFRKAGRSSIISAGYAYFTSSRNAFAFTLTLWAQGFSLLRLREKVAFCSSLSSGRFSLSQAPSFTKQDRTPVTTRTFELDYMYDKL
jgi:hypothetical protein